MSRGQLGWAAAVGLACFAAFVVLAVLIRTGWTPLVHLDRRVAADLHDNALAHPGQLRAWRDVSSVFAPNVLRIAAAVAAAILLLWKRAVRPALVLAIAVVGTYVLSSASKVIVDRNRPRFAHAIAHAAGQSYPSGHALTSFVALAAVLLVCSSRIRRYVVAPGVLIVVAVGYSRMILGVHYLSDVVGGWLLGAAWIGLVALVLRHSRVRGSPTGRWPRSRRRPQPR